MNTHKTILDFAKEIRKTEPKRDAVFISAAKKALAIGAQEKTKTNEMVIMISKLIKNGVDSNELRKDLEKELNIESRKPQQQNVSFIKKEINVLDQADNMTIYTQQADKLFSSLTTLVRSR